MTKFMDGLIIHSKINVGDIVYVRTSSFKVRSVRNLRSGNAANRKRRKLDLLEVADAKQGKLVNTGSMMLDATPDEEYPIRILRHFLEGAEAWVSNSTNKEEPESQVLLTMNEHNAKRVEILKKAINKLL